MYIQSWFSSARRNTNTDSPRALFERLDIIHNIILIMRNTIAKLINYDYASFDKQRKSLKLKPTVAFVQL